MVRRRGDGRWRGRLRERGKSRQGGWRREGRSRKENGGGRRCGRIGGGEGRRRLLGMQLLRITDGPRTMRQLLEMHSIQIIELTSQSEAGRTHLHALNLKEEHPEIDTGPPPSNSTAQQHRKHLQPTTNPNHRRAPRHGLPSPLLLADPRLPASPRIKGRVATQSPYLQPAIKCAAPPTVLAENHGWHPYIAPRLRRQSVSRMPKPAHFPKTRNSDLMR